MSETETVYKPPVISTRDGVTYLVFDNGLVKLTDIKHVFYFDNKENPQWPYSITYEDGSGPNVSKSVFDMIQKYFLSEQFNDFHDGDRDDGSITLSLAEQAVVGEMLEDFGSRFPEGLTWTQAIKNSKSLDGEEADNLGRKIERMVEAIEG